MTTVGAGTGFTGIPRDALEFFAGLELDNSREYFLAHRDMYQTLVRAPVEALAAALEPRVGPMKVLRLNRDVRLSKDKTPYRLRQAAVAPRATGGSLYVHVDDGGVMAAARYWRMERDQLERYRAMIDDDRSGPQVIAMIDELRAKGLTVSGGVDAPLKTRPRGVAPNHPRLEQLRWKGIAASTRFDDPAIFERPDLVGEIIAFFDQAEPLLTLIDRWVGPSESPSTAFGRRV